MVFLFILDSGRLARGLAAVVYDIPKKREKVIAKLSSIAGRLDKFLSRELCVSKRPYTVRKENCFAAYT